MKKRKNLLPVVSLFLLLSSFGMGGCSSQVKEAQEENHATDMTLHQVETQLEDSQHGVHCLQSELQILEGRIKQLESSLALLKNSSEKVLSLEHKQQELIKDIKQLSSHANETTGAFSQYKNRIGELEKELTAHNQKLEEVHQLKGSLESVAHSIKQMSTTESSYRVRPGDSLERIAKKNRVSLEALKSANGLDNDRIVAGQELKIPASH